MMSPLGARTLDRHNVIAPAGQCLLTPFVGGNWCEETTSTGEML